MKSLIIAWKDFKIRFTDKRGFLLMIFMPLLLTAILGSALSGVMEGNKLPNTVLGYYQEDHDSFADMFKKDVLQSADLSSYITVKEVASREELTTLIQEGKVDAGLIIPAKWSENINQGELKQPILLSDPGKTMQSSIIETVIQSFSQRAQTASLGVNMVVNDLAKSTPVMTGSVNLGNVAYDISNQLKGMATEKTGITAKTAGKKSVSSMQYYSVGMGVMFLLFNISIGAKMIIAERSTETLARLMSTPTSALSIITGKFIGTLLFSVMQFVVFVAGTHYFFGVDWGDNMLQIAAVGLSYSICVSGLSMLLAGMIKSEKTADTINGVVIQLLALLGGSMLPLDAFPDSLKVIANIAPNKWALVSFLDIMGGVTWQELFPAFSVLLIIGFASLILGTWRLQAR
ncbi:ABC transporter permease [Ectobacillus polymachus]|uniref:ABC transporter permease n=1 Tax=Ectobacillus polymachus TaxID=1508806 RepID=UPI003A8AABFC